MADHGLDGDVVAAEGEELVGGGGDKELLEEIFRCEGIDDPGPAQVHAGVGVLFGGGDDVFVVGIADVHEDERDLRGEPAEVGGRAGVAGEPVQGHGVVPGVVAGVEFHGQPCLAGLVHRLPEKVVFEQLAVLGGDALAGEDATEDRLGLFGRDTCVVDVAAVRVLGLGGDGVAAVTVEPPGDDAVPVGEGLDVDAGGLGVGLEVRAGEHADDAEVLHEEGGQAGFLEGLAGEAVDLAGLEVGHATEDVFVEAGAAQALVPLLRLAHRGGGKVRDAVEAVRGRCAPPGHSRCV
ncbi:MAG: hypothetical protein M5U12_35495 [Verrucomicrobia bacterium]|nr:hypothetical protein [Verrucomicrobiota bacterium]